MLVRTLLLSAAGGVPLALTLAGCGGGEDVGGGGGGGEAPGWTPGVACDVCVAVKGRLVTQVSVVSQCAASFPNATVDGDEDGPKYIACACPTRQKVKKSRAMLDAECEFTKGLTEQDQLIGEAMLGAGALCPMPSVRSSENTATCSPCEIAYAGLLDYRAAAYDCTDGEEDPTKLTPEQQQCACTNAKGGLEVGNKVERDCGVENSVELNPYLKELLEAIDQVPGVDCDSLPPIPIPGAGAYV